MELGRPCVLVRSLKPKSAIKQKTTKMKKSSIQSEEAAWIQNPRWAAESRPDSPLVHAMILRRGATIESGDPLDRMIESARPTLKALARSDLSKVILVAGKQAHEDRVAVIGGADDLSAARDLTAGADGLGGLYEFPATDALVTTAPGHLLIIKTADCYPIVLWDEAAAIVGACHCGWRGMLARLAQKTARTMIQLGAEPGRLEAWIGPGICGLNYEVGADLVEKFRSEFPRSEVSSNGTHLDLERVGFDQLVESGLNPDHIARSGECTFADADRYHSYRRDGDRAGRLLTVAGMIERAD